MKRKMKQSRVLADLIAKTPEEPAEEINLPVKFYPFYVDVSKYEFTDKEKELIEKHKDLIDELETGFRNVKSGMDTVDEYDKALMKLVRAGLIWYPPVKEAVQYKHQIGDRTFLKRAKLNIEKGALRLIKAEEYQLEGMIEDYFDECIAAGKKPNLKTLYRRLKLQNKTEMKEFKTYWAFVKWLKRHDLP